MQELPHIYRVAAEMDAGSYVQLTSPGLEPLESAGPAEFGGPGDRWSPETLLIAAVADCLLLSFKAIARASRFDWVSIRCAAEARLERIERVTQFTEIVERVTLEIPAGGDEAKALRLLEKAEHSCLITNSMKASTRLEAEVRVAAA